jgi:hypothetical protein
MLNIRRVIVIEHEKISIKSRARVVQCAQNFSRPFVKLREDE